ncbi:MAG: flagellar hook-associated protein FlgK [Deltaproteobacteria bacterium]|nr:flagellar hook-associated protein FlgK [Deltaproteobacteria bacterium]
MVVGLSNALNTAKVGLMANMTSIDIIGHNIANANNPDYRRQVGNLETTNPIPSELGPRGTGVQVSRVESLYDRFLFRQINYETSNQGKWDALTEGLDSVERVFSDLDENGLATQMAEFWGAWEDLANEPGGSIERATLAGKSQVLAATFNAMGDDLAFQRQVLNNYIETGINDINGLADSLRDMNQAILESEVNGGKANDLRDRQLAMLSDLSELVDIDYNEDNTGQLNVMMAGGKPLVLGSEVFHLKGEADDNGDVHAYFGSEGVAIDDLFGAGKMKGWIEGRKELVAAQDGLDKLSGALVFAVNQVHFQGYNLEGENHLTFFDHSIDLLVGNDNAGDATLSFSLDSTSTTAPEGIAWATLADTDDYEIRFNDDWAAGGGADEFTVVNTTTGKTLDASLYAIDESNAGSGRLIISFNGSGDAATADNGYHLELDFGSGTAPQEGDVFSLSFTGNAARTIALNEEMLNPDKIAISDNYFEVPGNNKVGLEIAQLQHQRVIDGRYSFSEYYTGLVSSVGSASYTAQSRQSQSQLVLEQLDMREESVSGVSIDEEMTNLIKFQQGYQATARMVTAIDELMQVLNDML